MKHERGKSTFQLSIETYEMNAMQKITSNDFFQRGRISHFF